MFNLSRPGRKRASHNPCTKLLIYFVVSFASLLGACSDDDDLAAIRQEWIVRYNGVTYDQPNNRQDGCDRIGVSTLRFGFIDLATNQLARELSTPCAFGVIDTNPNGVIRFGSYRVLVDGLNDKNEVKRTIVNQDKTLANIQIYSGFQYLFASPIDISIFEPKGTDIRLSATWRVAKGGTGTLADQCTARGANFIKFRFIRNDEQFGVDDSVIIGEPIPCAQGAAGSGAEARGSYTSSRPILSRGKYVVQGILLSINNESKAETVIAESDKITNVDLTGDQTKTIDIDLSN